MGDPAGAWCGADQLVFRLRDPDRRLRGVRLLPQFGAPPDRLDFGYDEQERAWRLDVPRPKAWRVEYLFEQQHPGGGVERICDPENPHRVPSAFGDRSVLECPDYHPPGWLRQPGGTGSWRELTVPAPSVRADLAIRIWSPGQATDRLVLVHDGPDYDRYAELGRFTATMVSTGRVAPHHLVLLDPGVRDDWYSANPAYANALATELLPRLRSELDSRAPVVGIGTSLGGLAMLHAQRRHPREFAGLFLQSGSFFRPAHDRHESGFGPYRRIVRFTNQVVRATRRTAAAPATVLTCGLAEENLANNREMASALHRQGYPAHLFEVPDAHNFTGWRDAFDPYLTDLLRWVFGTAG
jgi:enterochelin esterase-like enzyme